MLKNMSLVGRYLPGDSVLHRSGSGTKIALSLLFMASLYYVASYGALLLQLLFITTIAARSGGSPLYLAGAVRPVICLAAIAAVANMFLVKGEPVSGYGILGDISLEGIHVSIKMLLRLCLMAATTTLLTRTTSPVALAEGLERLLLPLKRLGMPVHETAMMLTIALRFIPTILDETEKIIKARKSRYATFGTGNLLARARGFIPLLAPLFASTLRRGDDLALAMEARCYRGAAGRTRMRTERFSTPDLMSVSVMLLLVMILLIMEHA